MHVLLVCLSFAVSFNRCFCVRIYGLFKILGHWFEHMAISRGKKAISPFAAFEFGMAPFCFLSCLYIFFFLNQLV